MMFYQWATRGVTTAVFLFAMAMFAGKEFPANPGEETKPGELIVRLAATADPAAILGAIEHTPVGHGNTHLLKRVPPGLAKQLAANDLVDYVEPNRVRHTTLTPNDPSYASQWALTTVRAAQAWSVAPNRFFSAATVPAGRIRVAILDTGIDCTHPDFMNASGTSADSASGGQINFALSSALVATTTTGAACAFFDDQGHGTHTAGTVGAATHNSTGVASLGYPVELLIYKVLDSTGIGDDAVIARAITQATDNGARVISMSFGGDGYSQTLQDAVNYAWQRNVLVVAAAGNSNSNALDFPGGANHAIAVAASDQTNNRAGFSNWGNSIDIAAPGTGVLSTYPVYKASGGYALLSGTSMSTPHVAALAGLLAGTTPNVLMDAVIQRIQRTANSTYANGGWGQDLGYGVIDAASAMAGTLRAATMGSVVGQVVTTNGVAVGNATVTIGPASFTTAIDGLFRIANLSAGSYTVTVAVAGSSPVNAPVNVAGGADTTVTIAVAATYGTISGTVTENGAAQGGLIVQALSSGLVSAETVTDAQGRYSLAVRSGTYTIRAGSVGDVTTTSAAVSVTSGASSTMNLDVSRMGWITGVVRDQNGNPLSNLPVSIGNTSFTSGAVTDSTGTYRSIGLPAGAYTVSASSAGFADAVASNVGVAAGSGATANLQFTGTTVFTPIRVNAGGGALVDSNGNTWAADYGYNGGGGPYANGNPISGTTTPALYQSERWSGGTLQYTFAVPNGTYTVNLKFAEIYFTSAGQRVFNIALNGATVQTNFDVCAAAGGPNTAIDRSYTVNVTTGQIVIALVPVVSNPKISAIEITTGSTIITPPPPPPPTTFTPIRVNAGGGAVIDGNGNTWSADTGYSGGGAYASGAAIANTSTPALYQTERYSLSPSPVQYTFAVPTGTYTVNLKFAEIYFFAAGQRVFDIQINGATVRSNLDVFTAAGGANRAIDQSYTVNVTTGQVVITLVPVISNPKISAIEILSSTTVANNPPPFSPIRVNAGGADYTDGSGTAWSADTGFNGGGPFSTAAAIANTTTPALYQSERYIFAPANLTYTFAVPNATYNVKLKFAEIYFSAAGQRVFNIQINGTTVESNFDVYTAAGGANRAIDKTYPVTVTTGQIVISLVPVVSNPKISAIEIQ